MTELDDENPMDGAGGGDDWSAVLERTARGWTGLHDLLALARSPVAWRSAHGDAEALSRRELFKWLGAGAAIAGLAACSSRPAREIRPYVHQPPEVTPGVPIQVATALVEDGFATGVIVESHEGRPVKVEGNPDHPASLGATRAIEQAAVLSLYDPARLRSVTDRGLPVPWSSIERALRDGSAGGGAGLQLLLEPTSSPIVAELIQRVRRELPLAGLTFWSPFSLRASLAGTALAFGAPVQPILDLRTADVIVALDADLVGAHPMSLAYTRQLSDRRRVVDERSAMSRVYVFEAAYTPTGVIADHRIRARSSEIEGIARRLLAELQRASGSTVPGADVAGGSISAEHARWIALIAGDLQRAAGRCIVIAGERQPPIVHTIAAAINGALGNVGHTVSYVEPVVVEAGTPSHELGGLAALLSQGHVRTLVVVGGNPAYGSPADLGLARLMGRATSSLYFGLHHDETAAACRYVAPLSHSLEQWGIARAFDGTLTPIQPLIEPLFGGRSVADVLEVLLGDTFVPDRERTAAAWKRVAPAVDFEHALSLGAAPDSARTPLDVQLSARAMAAIWTPSSAQRAPSIELDIRPHPFVYDGRYANNPWLQELPEPITKLTWDNAAQVSPRTAARLSLSTGDVVGLAVDGREIDVPVIVVPGHADDSITLHAGFGRSGEEPIARGIGASAFRIWSAHAPAFPEVEVHKRGSRHELAITQDHWRMEHRPVALTGSIAELALPPFRDALARSRAPQPSLIAAFPMDGAQWAMTIDLTTCTGCTACVMACAAENNTPVVGKAQVAKSREMHWIRIDRYFEGTPNDASIVMQPMTCQHCEKAPCEYVCPVAATTHSPDGLNEMTYNRCVGTRFCSNNCPYKVRRFNWFDLKQHEGPQVLARNPDVTVRDRGVMEKCTYCVQRIRRAEIDARVEDRPVATARVMTACQQVCPAQAIAFGSITDPSSVVAEQRRRPHSYAVLHDQGTAPRTMYLALIRNPNPERR